MIPSQSFTIPSTNSNIFPHPCLSQTVINEFREKEGQPSGQSGKLKKNYKQLNVEELERLFGAAIDTDT